MVGALVKAKGGPQLRDHSAQNGAVADQILRPQVGQQTVQLGKYPFPGQIFHETGQVGHGFLRFFLRCQPETDGEPDTPQDPQGILPESGLGIAHGTQNAFFQVFPAAEGVAKASCGRICHGVDGEIPAGKVFFNVSDEFHPIRMPVVPVVPFGAEGGDLHHLAIHDNAHGAVLFAGQNQGVIGKNRLHLGRRGGGAEVVVMGRQPQTGIPDAAAYGVGSKTRILQPLDAGSGGIRQEHHASSPLGN